MLSLIGQQGPGPWPIARGRVVMATDTLTGPLCARSLSAGELGAMAKNLYGPGVRMGNWNEDVYLEEVQRVRPAQSAGGPGTPMPRLSSGPCFELPRLLCHPAHAQVPKIPPLSQECRCLHANSGLTPVYSFHAPPKRRSPNPRGTCPCLSHSLEPRKVPAVP